MVQDTEALLQALNDDPANDDITLVLRQSSPGLCVVAADVTFSYAVPSLPAPVPGEDGSDPKPPTRPA